jgi:hypothetical protein
VRLTIARKHHESKPLEVPAAAYVGRNSLRSTGPAPKYRRSIARGDGSTTLSEELAQPHDTPTFIDEVRTVQFPSYVIVQHYEHAGDSSGFL